MKSVSVLPAESGWVVRSDVLQNDQLFFSGGRAEAAGRRLVEALEAAGESAKLEVTLRDGSTAVRRPALSSWRPPANDLQPQS